MDAITYLKTTKEICDACECTNCPILKSCTREDDNPELAVEIVEKWLNEKAPAVLPDETGAIEINHLQDSTDMDCCQYPVDPVIPELIAISNRLKELVDKETLHYIRFDTYTGAPEVYMQDDAFFRLFSFGEYGPHPCGEWDQVSTTVQGVEFFCLMKKGEPK